MVFFCFDIFGKYFIIPSTFLGDKKVKNFLFFLFFMAILSKILKKINDRNPTIVLITKQKHRLGKNTFLTLIDKDLYFNSGFNVTKIDTKTDISNEYIEVDSKNIYFKYQGVKYILVLYPVQDFSFDI